MVTTLLNFPEKENEKVWFEHNKQNITDPPQGDIYFLYHEQLPRIAVAENGNKEEIINYLSDKKIFLKPAEYLIINNGNNTNIFCYKEGTYSPFLQALDWEHVKSCRAVEITRGTAQKIVENIFCKANEWLKNPRSERMIKIVSRFFPETTSLTHELMQNAFDSKATKIKIDVEEGVLKFYHNGHIFTEADVASISDVNLTTKDKDKVGFMGMGFKSVFEASDKPEIHSGPFSFYFDDTSKGGKIRPININQRSVYTGYTTLIFMPIKNNKILEKINTDLLGFSKKNILNLAIEKEGRIFGITQISTPNIEINLRKGKVPNLYEIEYSENGESKKIETWLKFESSFKTEKEESKEFLDARDIKNELLEQEGWNEFVSITIPLLEENGKFKVIPYDGMINVYLPTKIPTKLNLDFQGNFIVDGSRTSLKNREGVWNSKLFGQLPYLLIKQLEWVKSEINNRELDITSFYSLIPDWENLPFLSENQVQNLKDNFKTILKSKELIPFESDKKIGFEFPSSCVFVDKTLVELFGASTLSIISNKKIVSTLLEELKSRIICCSEIEVFDITRLLNMFQEEKWLAVLPPLTTKLETNKWFSKLYAYIYNEINKHPDDYALIKLIETSMIFLVYDEASKKDIYVKKFTDNKRLVRLPSEKSKLPLEAFEKDSYIMSQPFLDYLKGRTGNLTNEEKEDNEKSLLLLEKIGILQLEPKVVITEFILPLFQKTEEYDTKKIVEYTTFICKNFEEVDKEEIKKCKFLNKSGSFTIPKKLFFPKEYGYPELETFFGDKKELFLSAEYLNKSSISLEDWKKLFELCGVNSKLNLKKVKEKVTRPTLFKKNGKEFEIEDSKQIYSNPDHPGSTYLYIDYNFSDSVLSRINEIQQLHITEKKELMRTFIKILDDNWSNYYSGKLKTSVEYFPKYSREDRPTKVSLKILTQFSNWLLENNWVPAYSSEELRLPKDIVTLTDENRSLFNEGIVLCEVKVCDEFAKFLKFKPTPENITNLDRLINLKMRNIKELTKYVEIYKSLCEDTKNTKLKESDIRDRFINEKLIFANDKFWSPEEIIFSPPNVLLRYYPDLKNIYPEELKSFFCEILKCTETEPTIEHMIRYLTEFVWKSDVSMTDDFRSSLLMCYRRIIDYLSENENNDFLNKPIWKNLKENGKVFCKGVGWKSINIDVPIIYRTSTKYEKEFTNNESIYLENHFIRLKRELSDLRPLLELFKVIPESDKVQEKFEAESTNINPHIEDIQKNLALLFEAIRIILSKEENEATANEKNEIKKFLGNLENIQNNRITVYDVKKIKTTLYLDGHKLFEIQKESHIKREGKELDLFLSEDIRYIYGSLSEELTDILRTNSLSGKIRNTVEDLIKSNLANLSININKSLDNFLVVRGYKERIIEEPKEEQEEEESDKEEETSDRTKNDESNETTSGSEDAPKGSYGELVEPIKAVSLTTLTSEELGKKDTVITPQRKPKKGHKSTFSKNPFSDEDGKRGEDIVVDKEKERLGELGLLEYIPKISHASEKRPENPWDIESFDVLNGNIVKIRIEVKSTPDSDNYVFPMSESEFKAALNEKHKKGRYFIYRVFDVRTSSPKIERFDFKEAYGNNSIGLKTKDFYMEIIKKK